MIKLEHLVLPSPEQMIFVIEGMRNPMNSWDSSDSYTVGEFDGMLVRNVLGERDLRLMTKLSRAGTDHRKFMRMMPVMVRITAPLYWWKEFDTYKVGTVANSCSTMHRIAAKKFDISDFSAEHVSVLNDRDAMQYTIDTLNEYRDLYLRDGKKEDWWNLIQLLPSSYNQTRNVMLNYEVISNMWHARKEHKLDEWRVFCKFMQENLLYFDELIERKVDPRDIGYRE